MGSKKKAKNTSAASNQQMQQLMQNQPSNEELMAQQQQMANGQIGNVGSGMSQMVQAGQQMLGQNPMMNILGGMMGMPVQIQAPEFMQDFINKYRPQPEPTQEQQFGPMPNQMPAGPNGQPFDINDHMRNQDFGATVAHSATPNNMGMQAMPDDYVPRAPQLRAVKQIMSKPDSWFNPANRPGNGGGR